MTYKEKTDPTPTDIELLTQNVAILTHAVQVQNEVIMCLLEKFDPDNDLPIYYNSKESFEREMNKKVEACVKAIRKIYGRSETDKN